jgi:hypothetical protein
MSAIPEGFRAIERLSPFNALVGPLYERRDGAAVSIAPRIEAKHTADLALGYAKLARPGDWVESKVDIQRVGAQLAFANCYLVSGGKPIVRASAIFARDGKTQ